MQTTFICFSHNLNYALGWMVVHSLWQATAIALLSGVLAIVLRDKTAKMRYLVSNMALVAVLVSAVVTFCIYYDFSKEAGQLVFIPDTESAVNQQLAAVQGITPVSQHQNLVENSPLSMEGLKQYFNRNIYLIVTIWALGVALFMLRLLGGISYVYYLKSRLNFPADEYWQDLLDGLKNRVGIQKGIDLLESALVRSPIVIGYLKPVILFPIGAINRLNPNEVEAILAHELAHVLRNDYLFNIIQSVIEALFYFHPAVWWISAQIRNERENCCDDVAIELCGNSMTYAKSLVSVQEMAYYSPQMAMAFAGKSNKNQLLMRVQRVLNQPQNKTNVREKLIATCLLVALMVSLSFSSNGLNRSGNDLINGNNLIENSDSTEGSNFLIFKNENNELDSLPISGDVKDGTYNFSDLTQTIDLTVKNKAVTQFNINGLEVASADIPKFERIINKIVSPVSPPSPPSPLSPMSPLSPPSPADAPEGLNLQSDGNQLTVNENGLHLNGTDEHGKPIVLSVDKNGFVMKGDGISMNFSSDEDTYEADAKPINGLKNYHKNGQISHIVSSNGAVQTYNDKGELESIVKSNGTIKSYKNKKLTTVTKNGHVPNYTGNYPNYNSNYPNYNGNRSQKDPYNPIHLTADNGFSYVSFNLNGENVWKCYKEGNLLGDLILKNNKPFYNGHAATSEELKQLGLLWYNNSFNPLTGGFRIVNTKINNKTNNTTNGDNSDCDDCWQELQDELAELGDEIGGLRNSGNKEETLKELQKAVRQLEKKAKNENMNKAEINQLNAELNNLKRSFNDFKRNCNKCDEDNGDSYNNSEQAKRDAEQAKRQAKHDAEQAKHDAEQAKRDAEQAKRDAEQARRNYSSGAQGAGYSYSGYGDSPIKSEIGAELRKDKLMAEEKAVFFIDGQQMTMNGKAVSSAFHKKYLKMLNDRNIGQNGGKVQFTYNDYSTSTRTSRSGSSYSRSSDDDKDRGAYKDNSKSRAAKTDLFKQLLNDGYISLDKKFSMLFDNDALVVNGKELDKAVFNRYKTAFENKLGKKTDYNITFKGIISKVTEEGLEMTGRFHIDMGD